MIKIGSEDDEKKKKMTEEEEVRDKRRGVRKKRIKEVLGILENAKENQFLDENALTMELCVEWDITQRTAREYIKIAKYKLNTPKKK